MVKKHILSFFIDKDSKKNNCCETTMRTFSIENDDTDIFFTEKKLANNDFTKRGSSFREGTILTETIETTDMDLSVI